MNLLSWLGAVFVGVLIGYLTHWNYVIVIMAVVLWCLVIEIEAIKKNMLINGLDDETREKTRTLNRDNSIGEDEV